VSAWREVFGTPIRSRSLSRNVAGTARATRVFQTASDREFLGRLTDGDLADEFQAESDTISAADPLLGRGRTTRSGRGRNR
jgi:hypothetical protein